MNENQNTILVATIDSEVKRGPRAGLKEMDVEILSNNVTLFLSQINQIVEKSPEDVGKFKFTKFIVTAEITATGQLAILGTGGSLAGKAALTFEFEKK